MPVCEPLPGVICPSCRMTPVDKDKQMYRWSHEAQAWLCPVCAVPYETACRMMHKLPLLRNEKNQTPIEKGTNMKKRQAKSQAVDVLRLSHSQLETWQQCQLRWRFDKIDHLPAAPSEALIFGTALHAALEADGYARRDNTPGFQDYELLAQFNETLQEELTKADPTNLIPRARHAAMRARAQDIIERYIAIVQPNYRPLEVEQDFSLQLSENVAFSGRIDAVTQSSILDWKTASKPWEPDSQHHKDQATAYLLARPQASRVSFAVFSGEGESLRFQSLATSRTEAQRTEYTERVLGIASDIRAAKTSGNYIANPGPLCAWCGYLGACTAGQAWLKVRGKVPQVPVLKYQAKAEGTNDAE